MPKNGLVGASAAVAPSRRNAGREPGEDWPIGDRPDAFGEGQGLEYRFRADCRPRRSTACSRTRLLARIVVVLARTSRGQAVIDIPLTSSLEREHPRRPG